MTDEEVISRCYEHGQPDYILAADAIKRLIAERDEARMLADNKVGWRSAYGAPNDGTPVLVYRGDHVAPLRRYGVDWRSPAKYQGKWACSRPDEQPLFYQELHPPIKAAPVVKRTTHG